MPRDYKTDSNTLSGYSMVTSKILIQETWGLEANRLAKYEEVSQDILSDSEATSDAGCGDPEPSSDTGGGYIKPVKN